MLIFLDYILMLWSLNCLWTRQASKAIISQYVPRWTFCRKPVIRTLHIHISLVAGFSAHHGNPELRQGFLTSSTLLSSHMRQPLPTEHCLRQPANSLGWNSQLNRTSFSISFNQENVNSSVRIEWKCRDRGHQTIRACLRQYLHPSLPRASWSDCRT